MFSILLLFSLSASVELPDTSWDRTVKILCEELWFEKNLPRAQFFFFFQRLLGFYKQKRQYKQYGQI